MKYLTYSHSVVFVHSANDVNNEYCVGTLSHKYGIIDCVLCNISLHDRKDSIKAIAILAQIFALCLPMNSSCPIYLKRERERNDSHSDSDSESEAEEERSETAII